MFSRLKLYEEHEKIKKKNVSEYIKGLLKKKVKKPNKSSIFIRFLNFGGIPPFIIYIS